MLTRSEERHVEEICRKMIEEDKKKEKENENSETNG